MPFDPTLPTEHTLADAAQMRAQFNGVVDLIQSIPQGPQGVPGPAGASVAGAVVDGVSTVDAGGAATASASFDGLNVRFLFGIPRGDGGATGGPGAQGIQGDVGPQGPAFTSFNVASTMTLDPAQLATAAAFFDGASVRFNFGIPRGLDGLPGLAGATGATGPAFTSFVVDSVTTLSPFVPATVSTTFDGTFVRFAFGIPQGQQGVQGIQGNNGFDGLPGPQGPPGAPGEVTAAQLAIAIAGTASNTNPIATLDIPISDPPTQSELTQVLVKVNELIMGLRR